MQGDRRYPDIRAGEPKQSASPVRRSVFLKILVLLLLSSTLPVMIVGFYEALRYNRVIYGANNPMLIVIGTGILLSIVAAGVISQDIIKPIKALVLAIKNHDDDKQLAGLVAMGRRDEFGYLFDRIASYQRELRTNAGLAALGRMTAMVAHDVRRPISNMQAMLTVLHTMQHDPEAIGRMVTMVDASLVRTSSILDELMEFSRGSERLRLACHDPQQVVGAAVGEALRSAHGNLDVAVEYDFQHQWTVRADSGRLLRVLVNIIDNAVDSMSLCGVEAVLRVETHDVQRSEGDFVAFIVKDNGNGFPDAVAEQVFEPFFTTRGENGGTGLGLAICKHIVSLHGGRITAINRVESHGAELRVEIPADGIVTERRDCDLIRHSRELDVFQLGRRIQDVQETSYALAFADANKQRGRATRVLVVDDERLVPETISRLLDSLETIRDHVHLVGAESAEEAIELTRRQRFDFLVADVHLGDGLDGYRLTERLLKEDGEIRVLIHSHRHSSSDEATLCVLGGERFLGFLPKPMCRSDLLQLLAGRSFAGAGSESETSEIRGAVILVANDDDVTRAGIVLQLRAAVQELNVLEASSVDEACIILREHEIDLVLTDINFGAMELDGYALVLFARGQHPPVPCIVVSGYSEEDAGAEAWSAGACAYLQTPVDQRMLLAALETTVGAKHDAKLSAQ